MVAGTTEADKGKLFLQNDLDPNQRQAIAISGGQVAEGTPSFVATP